MRAVPVLEFQEAPGGGERPSAVASSGWEEARRAEGKHRTSRRRPDASMVVLVSVGGYWVVRADGNKRGCVEEREIG